MDLETQGSESELDLISAIGVDDSEAEVETVEEKPVDSEALESDAKESEEPDPKEEIARLQRIIATDPAKRAVYEAEKYGVPYPQAQAPSPPSAQSEAKELSLEEEFAAQFPGEDFDPFNMKHQAFLQQINLRPAFGYIDQVKKEESELKRHQAAEANRQAVEDLNKGVQDLFVKGLPVIGDLLKAEKLKDEEQLLLEAMESKFQRTLLDKFPQRQDGSHIRLWASPEVHKEIVREIMPTIKQLAVKLGLSQVAEKKTVDRQVAKETYVESSNAVPSTKGNPFDEALAKGDIASALGAFSKTYR